MCDYGNAIRVPLTGSGKLAAGWVSLPQAQVYHDHFLAAQVEEGVVIDFLKDGGEVPVSLCLELSADSARGLAQAILDTVDSMQLARRSVPPAKEPLD
jgi:hypothetical protein